MKDKAIEAMPKKQPKFYKKKVGACFLIPLNDGRYAYCQYVHWHEQMGPLFKIFDLITTTPVEIESLDGKKALFPPVFIGLGSAIKSGRWKQFGLLGIEDFSFPKFRQTFGTKPGEYHDWKLWDGKNYEAVGDLPEAARNLEILCGWSPQLLEKRIAERSHFGQKLH